MDEATKAAVFQVFEWARAHVDNETCIREASRQQLTDAEKGALILMDLVDAAR